MSRKTPSHPKARSAPPSALPARCWQELAAHPAVLCLAAVGLGLALYWRTLGYGFIDLDDPVHIVNNRHVMGGLTWANVRWAFFDLKDAIDYWHPVSLLSLMLDASLYGQWAGGFHATNFLLHAANVALVFLLVRALTGGKWPAFAVAVLFAVHPAHLESVVWITERKDVLFVFWGLAALNCYIAWARGRGRPALAAFYCCYGLSLMSKPVLVVLPGLLLLLDYWPLNRWSPFDLFAPGDEEPLGSRLRALRPLVLEKLPMLALGGLSVLLTLGSSPKDFDPQVVDNASRYANALLALARYAWKLLVPTDLAILYPFPAQLPVWQVALSAAGCCAALLLAVRLGRRRPWLPVGLGWFFLGLLPTIVVPKTGVQVALADRFAYFPFIGGYLLLALGAGEAATRLLADPGRRQAALALGLLALTGWYWSQADFAIGFWRDKYAIYERSMEAVPGSHILYNNYGRLLADRGDFARAEVYVRKSLALQPGYTFALGNLGNIAMSTGRFEEALGLFQRALAPDPHYVYSADDRYGMGYCLARLGRLDEAEAQYRLALEARPDFPQAYNDLGNIALLRGDARAAAEDYAQAVALAPGYDVARGNLDRARALLARSGQ